MEPLSWRGGGLGQRYQSNTLRFTLRTGWGQSFSGTFCSILEKKERGGERCGWERRCVVNTYRLCLAWGGKCKVRGVHKAELCFDEKLTVCHACFWNKHDRKCRGPARNCDALWLLLTLFIIGPSIEVVQHDLIRSCAATSRFFLIPYFLWQTNTLHRWKKNGKKKSSKIWISILSVAL